MSIRLRLVVTCDHHDCDRSTESTGEMYIEPVDLQLRLERVRFPLNAQGETGWTADGRAVWCPEHAKGAG